MARVRKNSLIFPPSSATPLCTLLPCSSNSCISPDAVGALAFLAFTDGGIVAGASEVCLNATLEGEAKDRLGYLPSGRNIPQIPLWRVSDAPGSSGARASTCRQRQARDVRRIPYQLISGRLLWWWHMFRPDVDIRISLGSRSAIAVLQGYHANTCVGMNW
ncbi:hypothetical protein EV126DRAFT_98308 [Verticillium dahliae]|nr:hypothetical protein EV126DRAFT_98308 [Verticillium dahliae]